MKAAQTPDNVSGIYAHNPSAGEAFSNDAKSAVVVFASISGNDNGSIGNVKIGV
jgi:hypothetical protein